MRILGIDPGLQVCGYACLEAERGQEKLIEAGVMRTECEDALERRLNRIAEDTRSLLRDLRPEVVAVEQLYSHYAHRGVILQECAAATIEVRSFSATRIKKSITGNGRASKEQVQRTIQTILCMAELPEPNDVADAIAAAMCCANSVKIAVV